MADWFESWFDSSFYHKLYFDRDEQEANQFIANLMAYLHPPTHSYMLDVACGKGRHAKTLASFGHFVTGIDIAPQSIAFANESATDNLEFLEHDMRLTFRVNYYDYAFNLFTSFGYFKTNRENEDAIRTIKQSLKPNGFFVLDYLNTNYVEAHLIKEERKIIDSTEFNIKRIKTATHFIKQIQIEDASLVTPLLYQEKVAALHLNDFELFFSKQNLKIFALFGNYKLDTYDINTSPRLILVAQKIGY